MANWMDDPAVAHIDKNKLAFLQSLVFESSGLSKEQMLPFLMAVAKRGKESKVSFSDEEINCIIATLRKYTSSEDLNKMDKMINLYRTYHT